eukprot:PLAT6652.5.p2 GENE.PLAT6652.5~~PLAT6652.5.p2  ORF type:complete len:315 (+),score=60.74 PLAT6652.5:44-988(+)
MSSRTGCKLLSKALESKDVAALAAYVEETDKDVVVLLGRSNLPLIAHCARFDFTAGISWLLEEGADAQAKAQADWVALHLTRSAAAVKVLVDAGADTEARDAGGRTPLLWAVEECSTERVAALLEAGADVDATDNRGRSGLIVAASRGYRRIVLQLMAAGADATCKTAVRLCFAVAVQVIALNRCQEGRTAEDCAHRERNREIAGIIRAGREAAATAAAAAAARAEQGGKKEDAEEVEELDGDMSIEAFLSRVSNAFAEKYTPAFHSQDIETLAHLADASLDDDMTAALDLSVGATKLLRKALSRVQLRRCVDG